jgi:hypothetical protein
MNEDFDLMSKALAHRGDFAQGKLAAKHHALDA